MDTKLIFNFSLFLVPDCRAWIPWAWQHHQILRNIPARSKPLLHYRFLHLQSNSVQIYLLHCYDLLFFFPRVCYQFIGSWLHSCATSWTWDWAKHSLGTTNSWRCCCDEFVTFSVDLRYQFCRDVLPPSAEDCSQGPKTQQWYKPAIYVNLPLMCNCVHLFGCSAAYWGIESRGIIM